MSYNPAKPNSGPSPALDASIMQTNFSQYGTLFNANHLALGTANQGAHGAVILESQSADPGVNQGATVLYNRNASSNAGTQPQLFAQVPKFLPNQYDTTNAPNLGMQLTYNAVNTMGPVYQSFLAGGYLLFFGTTSNIAIPITLSPVPTKLIMAQATPYNMTTTGTLVPYSVNVNVTSSSTFTIASTLNVGGPSVGYTFGWWAIGTV